MSLHGRAVQLMRCWSRHMQIKQGFSSGTQLCIYCTNTLKHAFFINPKVIPQGSTRGHTEPTSAVISVHLSLYQHVSVIKRIIYTALHCVPCRDVVPPYTCVPAGQHTVDMILVTDTVHGAKRCRRYRNSPP